MRLASALLLLGLLGGAAAAGRHLTAPTPTQALNAQRQQQAEAAASSSAAKAAAQMRRLKAPCFVPSSFYPFQTCDITTNSTLCARGYLAFPSYDTCCAPQRGAIGVWKEGCTDFNKQVACWVVGDYFPKQTCRPSTEFTECTRNWGRWASERECCAPGRAHNEGCTKPEPCFVANAWYPARTCAKTEDQGVCQRGWGAFESEDACCQPGGGHSEGCGAVEDVLQA